MDGSGLVVVIPAYNEAATIYRIVTAARQHSAVLVVDDHSLDNTGERATAAGAIVVSNPRKLGYEATLNRGFAVALELGFDYVVTLDADGEHDPAYLVAFAEALVERNIPIVLGVRGRKQRFAEVIMGLYVQARFGVHDILCGMKGYRAELVRLNGGFDTTNSIGTDLALNSIRKGYPYLEVAVSGTQRMGVPRFGRRWSANMRIIKALCRLVLRDFAQSIRHSDRHI